MLIMQTNRLEDPESLSSPDPGAAAESRPMDSRHQEIAHSLFRESNDALFIFDPKDHRVLDVNPAALRLTGSDRETLCALRVQDIFSSAEPGGLDRLVAAYRRTGFYHARDGYFLARETGEPMPVNVSASRIHTKPDPMGLVVARDISERIRAQAALRESEARYRGLVETAKVIIWSVDSDGRIESLNPAFEEITGWPTSAWIGRHFSELVHPDDLRVADDSLARSLRGEPPPPREFRCRASSGDYRILEVLSSARQQRGEALCVSGVARDVTEQRRAEEALQRAEAMRRAKEAAELADRAKGEFLGHVSHEIRTPLTTILGFTDLLLEDDRVRALPVDLLEGLGTIKQNGGHLLNLINDILDLTKIEAGRLRIDRSPCSSAQVAGDVVASMRLRAEAKGLTLDLEAGPDVPASIRTDVVRLRQILINLLSNAIKFTHAGGVRLRIDRDPTPDAAQTLRFAVIDSGVGLSEEEVGRLFQPFYTSDGSTTRDSGAGLGLAISRRLAEMLGGRIDVRSRPGEGSGFTLILPLEAAPPAVVGLQGSLKAGAAGIRSDPTPTRIPPDGRILLAEDNEAIRRFLALRLHRAGVEVAAACNGQEAVDQAVAALEAGRPFDWILMDLQMPVLDGYEATRQLRSRGYRAPIIALTAYATAENREECLRFGCDDHLSKPLDWDRLIDVLATHRQATRD
jgi:PAS domain S-box-containing protein